VLTVIEMSGAAIKTSKFLGQRRQAETRNILTLLSIGRKANEEAEAFRVSKAGGKDAS